jgi:hypothetical protein
MPTIDIPLPDEVRKQMEMPRCIDIELPKPTLPKLTLPTGGTLKGLADFTNGIPNDCSLNLNLVLQLGPILASMQCFFEVLKLLGAMKKFFDAVSGDVFAAPKAATDVIKAFEGVAECISFPFGTGAFLFTRDLLRLIGKVFQCLGQQLKSIAGLLGRLEVRITSAQKAGNGKVLESLECAKKNTLAQAQGAMLAIEPLTLILGVAEPFLGIAGVPAIKLPALADPADAAALDGVADTLLTVSGTLRAIADGLLGPR